MPWKPVITFFVPGVPAPGGSKTARAFVKNGKPFAVVHDAGGKKNKNWRSIVALCGRDAFKRPLLDEPLRVEVMFHMPRPKAHFHTGRRAGELRADAPKFHTNAPDVLKLMRSTEDALTGIIWRDDKLIVDEQITKPYSDKPGATIRVSVLEVP